MRFIVLWLLIAVSIPTVWRQPLIGFIIYFCANIIRPEMLFWGGLSGSKVFLIYYVLTVLAAFFGGYSNRLKEVFQKEFLLMLWMLAAIFLSILLAQYNVSREYYYAIELLKIYGLCAMLYILVSDFTDIQRLQTVFLCCWTFLGIWGIEQQFRGNERLEGLGGHAWGDSNGVAAVFVMFLPVALARAFSSKRRRDFWISLGMATIMVALIVCTKSRGGLLGLLTGIFFFGFFTHKTVKVLKIALMLALFVFPFATGSYLERMNTMTTTDTENIETSARSRLILWQAGLMVFSDNPLFGTGFLTYPEAKMKYEGNFFYLEESFREAVFRKEAKKVTHNTYIQMLSDCGIVGGLPFILLISGAIRAGFMARSRIQEKPYNHQLLWLSGLSAGMAGFATCIIFLDAVQSTFIFVQLVCIGIVSRMVAIHCDGQDTNPHQLAEDGVKVCLG